VSPFRFSLELRMTEMTVTTGAIRCGKIHLNNHHHQQTNTQVFLQAGCPSCRPTNSVKALKGKYHIPWTCPKLTWGLPTLSVTTNSSWLPWGRVAMLLITPEEKKNVNCKLKIKLHYRCNSDKPDTGVLQPSAKTETEDMSQGCN